MHFFVKCVCSIRNWTVQFISISHISEKVGVSFCEIDYQVRHSCVRVFADEIAVVAMQAYFERDHFVTW